MFEEFEEIISFEEIGEVETYDLEIDSEDHNYYANDICVSNSHSLCYTYVACQTLYLKHYYPTEYYTCLLNHVKSNGKPEEVRAWISAAISSAISKGINVLSPKRNSDWIWKATGDNEITMGFSAIKGFGEIAYQELNDIMKRKKTTFDTVTKFMFFDTVFSKFNKTAFMSLLKAGAFDDWSHSRIELEDLYLSSTKSKKKRKVAPNQLGMFGASFEPELKADVVKYAPSGDLEKRKEFEEVCNCDLVYIAKATKIKDAIAKKAKREVNSINDVENPGYYYFIVEKKLIKKTKTGKDFLEVTVSDGISQNKLRVFGSDVQKIDAKTEEGGVYIGKFKSNKGFINFMKVEKNLNGKKVKEVFIHKFDKI